MHVFSSSPDQIDRNTLRIERRFLLLEPQTVRDCSDEAYVAPPVDLPALRAFVAPLSGTTTNRSARKCFAPLRADRDESQRSRRRKCDALLIDLVLSRIYPVFSTSNRSPRGKP